MQRKKWVALGLAVVMTVSMAACGNAGTSEKKQSAEKTETKDKTEDMDKKESADKTETTNKKKEKASVAMITDTGGINDQSFNQSAWEGLQKLQKDTGAEVNYVESKQASDFVTNLDRLADNNATLLWGVGFACADAILETANKNPDLHYAIVDNSYEDTPANVTGVMFKAQEPSFMVGYVAARTTTTNKVGFVGGISSGLIDQFQYGYQAGVAYGAKELGKNIEVSVQYAESFSDAAKGKAIASKMFSDGCDVVYHAAGGTGVGVIESAKEEGKWAIGVDRDQAYLAPENVLTSALKLVGKAVEEVSQEFIDGKDIGGKTIVFGLEENCVGISEEHKNMPDGVYEATLKIADEIKAGKITPPSSESEFTAYTKGL